MLLKGAFSALKFVLKLALERLDLIYLDLGVNYRCIRRSV